MSAEEPGRTQLDARMRSLFAGVDTSPGFEARVMQRVSARSLAPRPELRAQIERARTRATRSFARQAWTNAGTAVGVGAAGIAIVWRHRLEVAQAVQAGLAGAADSGLFFSFAAVVLAVGLWPVLRRYLAPL